MKQKIYFLASKGLSLISKIIRFYQFGFPFTHIAIILNNNKKNNPFVAEMWTNGLYIGSFYNNHTEKTPFSVYSVEVSEKKYYKFFDELNNITKRNPKYDWFGILGFAIRNKNLESSKRFFCSELAFYLCQKSGINLLINTKPSEVTPRIFLKSPLLKFEYFYDGENVLDFKQDK